MKFKQQPDGSYVPVQNEGVAEYQQSANSHLAFASRADVRQRRRRMDAFQQLMQTFLEKRCEPTAGVRYETIKDEKWHDLMRACQADARGETDDFVPIGRYAQKLIKRNPDGTVKMRKDGEPDVVRPLLHGEVGVRPNGTIVILEQGYGTGNFAPVLLEK